jgi:hypothetical protein
MNVNDNSNTLKVKIWRSFEIKEKRIVVSQIDELVSSEWSRPKACALMGIPYMYFCHWNKLLVKIDGLNQSNEFVPYNTTGTAHRLHQGRKSTLYDAKPRLKAFIFKIREQGIQVTKKTVESEASRLLPSFKNSRHVPKNCVWFALRDRWVFRSAPLPTRRKNTSTKWLAMQRTSLI